MTTSTRSLSLTLLIGLAAIHCSSYGKIKEREDSYTNSKIVSMTLDHKSEETFGLFNMNARIAITYAKELKTGKTHAVEMKIEAPANATSELKPQAFLKADDQKFEVKIEAIQKTSTTDTKTHKKRDKDGKLTDTDTKTTTQYRSIGTINVPVGVWSQLMGSKKIGYRLYIDQEALTFFVSEEWREKLREFDAR